MKLVKKLLFILVIAVIAVMISYFARMNDTNVTLNLIFVSVKDIQLWLLSLFCFLAHIIKSHFRIFIYANITHGYRKNLPKLAFPAIKTFLELIDNFIL